MPVNYSLPILIQISKEKTNGKEAHSYLVFHGRLDSTLEEIHEAIDYGVVKMNIDTKMQYAFTRAIADHMFKHYDSVLKVDWEVGSKKTQDPSSSLAIAEAAMAERVKQAVSDLQGAGTTLFRSYRGDIGNHRSRNAATNSE